MDIRTYIDDLDIANGASVRRNCPVCDGLKTFTVTNKNGMIVWNCYKAGCSLRGATRTYLNADDIRRTMKQQKDTKPTWTKPDYIVQGNKHRGVSKFLSEWNLESMTPHPLYDVKDNRIVFPVFKDNVLIDGVGRALGSRLPKWKRYGESGLPYTYGAESIAVIVEDAISAVVVGQRGRSTGVALLGTSLQDSHKKPLTTYSKLIVALDPDALPKTLSVAQELRTIHPKVGVLRLENDLKYRYPQDLRNLEALISWN